MKMLGTGFERLQDNVQHPVGIQVEASVQWLDDLQNTLDFALLVEQIEPALFVAEMRILI